MPILIDSVYIADVMGGNSQLAVVQGLVMERWQVSSLAATVFKERCCRLSYGILCREEYDPENNPTHIGQNVFRSPHDGKLWVEGQIDWFLKQVCRLSNMRWDMN